MGKYIPHTQWLIIMKLYLQASCYYTYIDKYIYLNICRISVSRNDEAEIYSLGVSGG